MRLQTKLTLTSAALITGVSLLVGGAATLGAYQREVQVASQALKSDQAQILAANGQELSTALLLSYQQDLTVALIDSADVMTVVREGQTPLQARPSLANLKRASSAATKGATADGQRYLLQTIRRPNNEWMILVQSLQAAQSRLESGLLSLILYTTIADLLAFGLVALLIRRDLRSLRGMIKTARKIADGNDSAFDSQSAITEVGDLGEALKSMVSQLRSNQLSMQRFLGDASHELRTPLTVIRGYLELLAKNSGEPEFTSRAIGKMQTEVQRMQRLIEDLLLLTELGAAGRPLQLSQLDLAAQLRNQVESLRDLQPGRDIQVSLPESLEIQADSHLLDQLLANLFGNIRRHTGASVPVQVSLQQTGTEAILTVDDAGPGLAAEAYQRGMGFFERFDPSRSRENGGSGLGMGIMVGIAARHQGAIVLQPSPLGGLRTSLRLPIAQES